MTLEQIRRMYGMEEIEFRRLVGLPASISLDTPVCDIEMLGDRDFPSTEVIRKVFATRTPVAAPSSQAYEKNRTNAPGGNRRQTQSARSRGRGRQQMSSSSDKTLRGSTTLQQALAYSGKTLEQVKKDWDLSFLDPQTNLGTLARTLDVPMWELRSYFER